MILCESCNNEICSEEFDEELKLIGKKLNECGECYLARIKANQEEKKESTNATN